MAEVSEDVILWLYIFPSFGILAEVSVAFGQSSSTRIDLVGHFVKATGWRTAEDNNEKYPNIL